MKSIKTDKEIENIKKAYILDGVSLVKFFNWLEMLINAGSSSLLTILIIAAIESVRISGKRKTT